VRTPPKTFEEVIALDKKLSAEGKKPSSGLQQHLLHLAAAGGQRRLRLQAQGRRQL
jgi:maltose-binding protein MalE